MASVEAVLKLRSGETQVFSEPARDGSGPLDLVSTRKALLNIQKTVNDVLTELVNEEKKPGPSGDAAGKSSKTATDDNLTSGKEPSSGDLEEEEEEDDDNEDDDDDDKEPVTQRIVDDTEPAQKKTKLEQANISNGQSDSIKST